MAKLIAQPLQLEEVANYYNDSETALRLYFSSNNPKFENLLSKYSVEVLPAELKNRLDELDRSTSLTLLAAMEATFRIDYKERVKKRKKDNLSKALKNLYNSKELKASLEDDIFNAWLENTNVKRKLIEDLKGAYKYRHWLAHGRYWTPKMGRPDYDYYGIYQLVDDVLNSFPFEGL